MSTPASLVSLVLALAAQADAEEARHWTTDVVELAVSGGGGLATADVVDAVQAAADAWGALGVGPSLAVSSDDGDATVAQDGVNRLFFVDREWAHDARELALTFSSVESSTREIKEADVAVNADTHAYAIGAEKDHFDFQNMITHELGHFLGVRHLSDEEATMFGEIVPGETAKRDLTDVDASALAAAYEGVELTSSAGGCSATDASGTLAVLPLALSLVLFRRRRSASGR